MATEVSAVTPLPAVSPVAKTVVEEGNVLLTLANLEPGWYLARDLMPRYEAIEARLENRPGTKIQFGRALGRLRLESRYAYGHAKSWHVTPEVLARANDLYSKVARTQDWA